MRLAPDLPTILGRNAQAKGLDWRSSVAIDNPTSSDLTRETMGWSPREAGLLADLRDGGYFS